MHISKQFKNTKNYFIRENYFKALEGAHWSSVKAPGRRSNFGQVWFRFGKVQGVRGHKSNELER